MRPATYAFAFRSGHIRFGEIIPRGALPIGRIGQPLKGDRDRRRRLTRSHVEAAARLAYDNKTILVPGVPEAANDNEAYDAFVAWCKWLGAIE